MGSEIAVEKNKPLLLGRYGFNLLIALHFDTTTYAEHDGYRDEGVAKGGWEWVDGMGGWLGG